MRTLVYCRQIKGIVSSMAVSYRNAAILADELGADIIMYKGDKINHYNYDIIVLTYLNRYTDYTTLRKLLRPINQSRFLIRTEYESVNTGMRGFSPYTEIANFDGGDNFLNLNLLIAREPNNLNDKKYDCIYYSRYRNGRMKYCKEYLQGDIYFSTNRKNVKHFYHYGCRPRWINGLSWTKGHETLNQFRYSLYLEDEYTHNVFNNLANRWYEAGFCNNVVFFDVNCDNTIRKSELGYYYDQVKDYMVSNHSELMYKIAYCNQDFERHLAVQKTWRMAELYNRQQMIERLKEIIYDDAKK